MEKREIKAKSKAQVVVSQNTPQIDTRTIIVGDDTGLIKKVRMTFQEEEDVISAPPVRRNRNKNKRLAQDNEEIKGDK